MAQHELKQTVLVTGASSGSGKEIARLFAAEGFRTFGTSRRKCPGQDGVEMLKLDVCSNPSVQHCVNEALERTGHIDVLVNNAGIAHEGFAEEISMESNRTVFETNFFGAVRMINAVLPGMRHRRQGRIINIGSLAGRVAVPGEAFYSASKHALAGYTEALRQEIWTLGLYASLVEPDFFKSGIVQAGSGNVQTISDYDTPRQAVRHALDEAVQNGDDPRNVARLVLKVACTRSPRLRYGAGRDGRRVPRMKGLVPQRLFEARLRKRFGIQ